MNDPRDLAAVPQRLNSWKEIAAFFDRDERTVIRWEKSRGLPVHRVPGGSRGRVYAFSDELAQWLQSAKDSEPIIAEPETPAASKEKPAVPDLTAPGQSDRPIPPIVVHEDQAPGQARAAPRRGKWLFAVAAVVIGVAAVGFAMFARQSGQGRSTPTTADATDLYLKGRYYWSKRTPASLTQAVDFFTQAIVRDPRYADAYAGLAECYILLSEFSSLPAQEGYPRALAAAKRAVEIDDRSAVGHRSLAFADVYWLRNAAAAEGEFRKALALAPVDATTHHWYATFLMASGRCTHALSEIERARQLDAGSTAILADKGLILYNAGHVAEATALLKQLEESDPSFLSPRAYLSEIYWDRGEYRASLDEQERAARLRLDERQLAIAAAGQRGLASGGTRAMLQQMLQAEKRYYDAGQVSGYHLAMLYSQLGEKPEALACLRTAAAQHEIQMLAIEFNRSFDGIRNDPAFQQIAASSQAR